MIATRAGGGTPAAQQAHGTVGRVLLVDDVQAVLDITGIFLRKAGFEIVQALSAADALLAIAEQKPFCCLVTDQSMPITSGDELVRAVRVLCPGLPAVIITGCAGDEQPHGHRDGICTLHKPFTKQALLQTIRHLIALDGTIRETINGGAIPDTRVDQAQTGSGVKIA